MQIFKQKSSFFNTSRTKLGGKPILIIHFYSYLCTRLGIST
jgi:hypothetical protein